MKHLQELGSNSSTRTTGDGTQLSMDAFVLSYDHDVKFAAVLAGLLLRIRRASA